jgi:hypothetical protein
MMSMRRCWKGAAAAIAVLVVAAGSWSVAAGQAPDAAADLRQLTERRFAANAGSDRAFYEALLAANALVWLPFRAPLTKAAYLAEEFDGRPAGYRGAKATLSDFRAIVDGDTAVVSYTVVEPTPLGVQAFESRSQRLDTYVRRAGAWRLLSMTVAEVVGWPDVVPVDASVLASYAGTYELSAGMRVVVTVENGRLMQALTGQPKIELFPESATSFFDRADSPLARTVFERDASGAVVAQVYRAQGQRLRARRVGAG